MVGSDIIYLFEGGSEVVSELVEARVEVVEGFDGLELFL